MILILEDDHAVRETVKMVLEFDGFQCETVDSVEKCMQWLSQRSPNVLLADMALLDGDARCVIQYCRKHSPGMRIVVMSGLQPSILERYLKDVEVDYLIPKPFDVNRLEYIMGQCEGYLNKCQNP